MGVDETAFLASNGRHHTEYVTGMVDVTAARLLDVVPGRSGTVLSQWIAAQPEPWRQGVTVAVLDPFRGYPTALRMALPHANQGTLRHRLGGVRIRAKTGTLINVSALTGDSSLNT